MPPNEHDSVWAPPERREEQYLGHVFLIGLQRLRLLGYLAGFRIRRVHHSRANLTSLALLPLCYPAVVVANLLAYWRSLRRTPAAERVARRGAYLEQLRLGLDPRTLVDCHLFVEFERER